MEGFSIPVPDIVVILKSFSELGALFPDAIDSSPELPKLIFEVRCYEFTVSSTTLISSFLLLLNDRAELILLLEILRLFLSYYVVLISLNKPFSILRTCSSLCAIFFKSRTSIDSKCDSLSYCGLIFRFISF